MHRGFEKTYTLDRRAMDWHPHHIGNRPDKLTGEKLAPYNAFFHYYPIILQLKYGHPVYRYKCPANWVVLGWVYREIPAMQPAPPTLVDAQVIPGTFDVQVTASQNNYNPPNEIQEFLVEYEEL